jgi:hypothetical protein
MALIRYFGKYNELLDDWLFEKMINDLPANPLKELKAEFEMLSSYYHAEIIPDFVHIYSIASAMIQKNPEAALDIFIYGKSFYPFDHELDYSIISLLLELNKTEAAEVWFIKTLPFITNNPNLSKQEKEDAKRSLEGLLDE